jgi:hypothetical protein
MANRVMKQKDEKGKKQARDASEARKYGVKDTASYRKEMLHTTERPKKKDREAQDIEDSQSRAKAVDSIPGNKGKLKPLEIKESDRELKSSAGHQDVKPIVEKKAKRAQAERELGTGLSRVSKGGDIRPLLGREAQVVKNDLAANDKQLVKEANKRAAARDAKASTVDRTPEQKQARLNMLAGSAEKKKAAAAAKPVGSLPEAQTDRPSTRPLKVKKVNGERIVTGGAQIIPGEGKAGILNPANVARTAGTVAQGTRRRIERKAAYNAKKSGATKGYTEAAKLGTRTSETLNARAEATSESLDTRARTRAARKDAKRDSLKRSILKKAEKMPEGSAKSAAVRAGESIIQAPVIGGKRGGMHEVTSIPDERDITKVNKRSRPVGKGRLTDVVDSLGEKRDAHGKPTGEKERLKMSQQGEISTQPARPQLTPTGVLGSHEDRLHALTKMFQVPAGEGKTHDLEPVHLRSYLKHKSTNANVKFNERDVVGAVFKAQHTAPDTFSKIHKEVLEHRTKRIGQTTEQRERASAKAKDMRSMTRADRGGKRQAPKAKRVVSNVQNRFTEVPNGGKEA